MNNGKIIGPVEICQIKQIIFNKLRTHIKIIFGKEISCSVL